MQRIRGAALLPAALCLLAAPARADLNDGKPCFSYINPPGEGVRYVCTSTSSHTVEHTAPETFTGKAWRTRITARREGEPTIYDLTFDSLSEPLNDPLVKAAIANASSLVTGTGWTVAAPALLSSSTARVEGQTLSPATQTVTVAPIAASSSSSPRSVCVGPLGDLAHPPPPLPEAPCTMGASTVTLRALDTSNLTPLDDRLEDTHTHVQTDAHAALLVTGDLTTAHYEIVARPVLPCSVFFLTFLASFSYSCTSSSHHTIQHDSTSSVFGDAWSTRITGRLSGAAPLYDVTINATVRPDLDQTVRQAFLDARLAVAQAAGVDAPVSGPFFVSSEAHSASAEILPGGARPLGKVSTFFIGGPAHVCVGDFGDLVSPPDALPRSPCVHEAWTVGLNCCGDNLKSTHTHTQRDVYASLYVTGTLTTTHYEYVAEPSTSTLTLPIVLSASGGSAFSSELTLTNHGTTDTRATFAYTPAFGGTAGTVTDTLGGATQRIIPDAVAYLKSLGLTDPGAGGFLRMTFDGAGASDVYASVRTTAAVPEGRVGLAYAALPPSKLFSSPLFLSGLRQNSLDRSNVAVLNAGTPADGDVTLRLTVSSGDPANPQTKVLPDITLPPGGFSQISGILVSNGLSHSNGTVRVDRVSGSAPFYAYAVVNDQATNDGSFIEPTAANLASPISTATLPVLVETSSYSTELVLTNLSAANRTLNFTWVAPTLAGGRATFSISLLPGEQQILPGFVQLLRDRGAVTDARGPSFAGALFVSDSTGDLRGVAISARVLSALGNGRAGVALPTYPSGSESTTPVWLCGLQQNAETRSNLALVNTGSVDSTASDFRIDLYDGETGARVASPVATVPARGFAQIDRVLSAYAPGVTQGCALVTRTSGANPFLAYAVLNDGAQPEQRSGDGAYVASVPTGR